MDADRHTDWRTITALNAVSTLSQIGQFGIGFVVLPLWLSQQGLNAGQLGAFASSEWIGMLAGLAIAPRLNVRFGHSSVIAIGLITTIAAFASIPDSAWLVRIPAAALIGLGLGLRWIGLEPWLYRIAPSHARGRLVGFHETLIGLAPIIAPMCTDWVGIAGRAPFILGIGFTGSALLPLVFARPGKEVLTDEPANIPKVMNLARGKIIKLGVIVAVIGGITDAAFAGLFPIFGAGRHFSAEQMVTLLYIFGLGGLLLQYLVGWLADQRGLVFTTLVCATSTVLITMVACMPLGFIEFSITIFALGGFITAYLTLAIIAATHVGHGDLSVNVRRVSMIYTTSSIFGPLIAGAAMKTVSSEALIWQVGMLSLALCGYILIKGRAHD
jgi:MFS family permease